MCECVCVCECECVCGVSECVYTCVLRSYNSCALSIRNELPQVGFKPTTLCSLDECSATELSRQLRWQVLESETRISTQ